MRKYGHLGLIRSLFGTSGSARNRSSSGFPIGGQGMGEVARLEPLEDPGWAGLEAQSSHAVYRRWQESAWAVRSQVGGAGAGAPDPRPFPLLRNVWSSAPLRIPLEHLYISRRTEEPKLSVLAELSFLGSIRRHIKSRFPL